MALSPIARGHAPGSQTKGWELCQWRGRDARWARPTLTSASSLFRAFRSQAGDGVIPGCMGQASSVTHQLCGLGPGTPLALCKREGVGGREAAIQAALVSGPLRGRGAFSEGQQAAVYSCSNLGHPCTEPHCPHLEMGRIIVCLPGML